MLRGVHEFTDITALIKSILNGYPGNSAIFREYLQNSDDAGATSQVFILDERSYPTDSVVDPALRQTQGPALLAVNDGFLRDVDWTALRKISSSSKAFDEKQTGKNGLGFRASYHLTENPHILSGRGLMILDPHHAFQVHKGGIFIDSIDAVEQRYKDQFLPFRFLLDDIDGPFDFFDGTAFRLPLRTELQALRSQIKDTATSASDIWSALLDFAENDLEESILFLKNITSIHIRHINSSGIEETSICISVEPLLPSLARSYTRDVAVTTDGTRKTRTWMINRYSQSKDTAERVISDRLGYDVGNSLIKDKLVASVELAIPIDMSPIHGRLFALLPLPLFTDFPVHLNASFALSTDRQNLKNVHEVGQATSRERRLVEWNRTIFDTWTPEAWADMLVDLPSEVLSSVSWALWPPEERGDGCYWAGLCRTLVRLVVSRGHAVFPARPYEMETRLVALHYPNVLIASSHPGVDLETLCELGIYVVQPPPHIYAIMSADDEIASTMLSAESLHRILCRLPLTAISYGNYKLHAVMDYLVFSQSPPALKYIADLQWFTCSNGYPASFKQPSASRYFIPSSDEEARVFKTLPNMLAWGSFSSDLGHYLSLPSAKKFLNVDSLEPANVSSYLSEKFGFLTSNSDSDEVPGFAIDWVLDFWSWLVNWTKQGQFFEAIDAISKLYLLPTAKGDLRKLSSGIIEFADLDTSVVEAWNTLGVSPLHSAIPENVALKLKQMAFVFSPRSSKYIISLIRSFAISPQRLMDERILDAFKIIRTSLCEDLPKNSTVSLTAQDKEKLSNFPISRVRPKAGCAAVLQHVSGNRIYVDIDDTFPMPHLQKSEIYIDVRDFVTQRISRLLELQSPKINGPFDLLRLAVDNWQLQSTTAQDLFADYALNNWRYMSSSLQSDFECLPFVVVNGLVKKPPRDLIHPDSALKGLYAGESGRMPVGRFAEKDYLLIMQSLGFLHAELDDFILRDRLDYLATTRPAEDPHLRSKAITFIGILDRHWDDQYTSLVESSRNRQWLPSSTRTNQLVSPSQCRDHHYGLHSNHRYYDLVLDIVIGDLHSSSLRSALGWSDVVPPKVLIDQCRHTLDLQDGISRKERLVALLKYLDQLWRGSQLPQIAIEDLRAVITDRSWVPVAESSEQTVQAQYALLSECKLLAPFRQIDPHLQDNKILLHMGCTHRPSFNTLRDELVRQLSSPSGVDAALAILKEMAEHHDCKGNSQAIWIPGEDCRPYPLEKIYYRDMAFAPISTATSDMTAAHYTISKKLAEALGIRMLSTIALENDEREEEQMSEDLVSRIRGFLRDYDPQYAFNEFVANAEDAGANQFHIYLAAHDQRTGTLGKVASPEFQSLLRSPSLIIHNNALLSEDDFMGLRKVGQGGKSGLSDTHGRHGLGALSMYYFTDVVTVISGESVMILDPSGRYFPPLMNGGRRTALKRSISDMMSQYPDQLKACEPFGISPASIVYPGTLFFLPLHSTISKKACDYSLTREFIQGTYRDLAQRAFFFTRMERITATEITAGKSHQLWAMSARRSSIHVLGENFSLFVLQFKPNDVSKNEETWFVTTSEAVEIPPEHEVTATELKLLPHSKMKVQLAINPNHFQDQSDVSLDSYPFSTMALPQSTSLPFHLNARFAISSNRQGLVLNSADSQDQRDRKTSFNTWILGTIVPPLFLASLEYLIHNDHPAEKELFMDHRWWLWPGICSDETSRITKDSLSMTIAQADNRIFQSADENWIPFRDSVFSKEEPSAVKEILNAIRAPKFVSIPHGTDIASIPGIQIVDPEFVKRSLLQHSRSLKTLRRKLSSKVIRESHIFQALHYIRKTGSLGGVPLLMLSRGEIAKVPKMDEDRVYIWNDESHFDLFPSSHFVQIGYTSNCLRYLENDDTVNVVKFTEEWMPTAVRLELEGLEPDQKVKWVKRFWTSFTSLPGPTSLMSWKDLEIPLIESSSGLVSLKACLPHEAVYESHHFLSQTELPSIFQRMGFEVVRTGKNTVLHGFLSECFSDPLDNVLKCIAHQGIGVFNLLGSEEHGLLAQWIRTQFSEKPLSWSQDPPVSKAFLSSLPIWEGYVDGKKQLCSLSELEVLPPHIKIVRMKPFLRANMCIAPCSSDLVKFIGVCKDGSHHVSSSYMSCSRVWNSMTVPTRITQEQALRKWMAFIKDMLVFSHSDLDTIRLMIPNRDGYLHSVKEFYDDGVELFAQSLMLSETSRFVHGDFCARAIQDAVQVESSDPARIQTLRDMSITAFRVYESVLPSQIMTNVRAWESLDNISFCLPRPEHRRGASYEFSDYVTQRLPFLLPPSRFVRPELEAIAWTQRASFYTPPAEELLAVNKKLGIPKAQEVVEHLKVLTTRIAIDHPGDRTLLSDIQATYKWLNKHHEEAKEHLLALGNEKLFLNVADPVTDTWYGQWAAAKDLVMHLEFDTGSKKYLRSSLKKFEDLLVAAGSSSLSLDSESEDDEYAPQDGTSSELDKYRLIWRTFGEMREKGELTDVVLVPDINDAGQDDDGDDSMRGRAIDESQLRAHGHLLAAAIPHLRMSLDKSWKSDRNIKFPGTAVGAKSLLDFVYTGEMEISERQIDDPAVLVVLQRDLLELLSAAEEWQMEDLKEKLQWEIIHKHKMIQRLPHTFDMMLKQAQLYNAEKLKMALRRFRANNKQFLLDLNRS